MRRVLASDDVDPQTELARPVGPVEIVIEVWQPELVPVADLLDEAPLDR